MVHKEPISLSESRSNSTSNNILLDEEFLVSVSTSPNNHLRPKLLTSSSNDDIFDQFLNINKPEPHADPSVKTNVKNIDFSDEEEDHAPDQNQINQISSSPTIQIDSPSMHNDDSVNNTNNTQILNVSNLNCKPSPTSSASSSIPKMITYHDPPTFADINNLKSNLTPITPTILAIENNSTTLILSSVSRKCKILKFLKNGLINYIILLKDATSNSSIQPRSEFLINYLKKNGFDLKLKMIHGYLNEIKNNTLEPDILNNLSSSFVIDFNNLLTESTKFRKIYNKLKNQKIANPNVSVNLIHLGVIINQRPVNNPQCNNIIKKDKKKLVLFTKFSKCLSNFQTASYFKKFHKISNPSIKSCISDIYPNLKFTHSLTYSDIPISLNPLISVNLENDQLMTFIEINLNIGHLIKLKNKDTFTSIIQLKSITRVYDDEKLIIRRNDPITGVYLDTENTTSNPDIIKIILPLQAKIWSSLINDYHNGIITSAKFNNLKISHTIYSNDDMVEFKNVNIPLHSFIWEFSTNMGIDYNPHCINIIKDVENEDANDHEHDHDLVKVATEFYNIHSTVPFQQQTQQQIPPPQQRIPPPQQQQPIYRLRTQSHSQTFTPQHNSSFQHNSYSQQSPLSSINLRGHKRTRSRSMNEISNMSFINENTHIFTDSFIQTDTSSNVSSPFNHSQLPHHPPPHPHNTYAHNRYTQPPHQFQTPMKTKFKNFQIVNNLNSSDTLYTFNNANKSDSHLELNAAYKNTINNDDVENNGNNNDAEDILNSTILNDNTKPDDNGFHTLDIGSASTPNHLNKALSGHVNNHPTYNTINLNKDGTPNRNKFALKLNDVKNDANYNTNYNMSTNKDDSYINKKTNSAIENVSFNTLNFSYNPSNSVNIYSAPSFQTNFLFGDEAEDDVREKQENGDVYERKKNLTHTISNNIPATIQENDVSDINDNTNNNNGNNGNNNEDLENDLNSIHSHQSNHTTNIYYSYHTQ